jgi:hypothetical protein
VNGRRHTHPNEHGLWSTSLKAHGSPAPSRHSSETLRHPVREHGWEPAVEGDADAFDAIDRHIERYFGSIGWVWKELASDLVHIDVHVVEPRPERPYSTLVTSGMSDRPTKVPLTLAAASTAN